MQMDFSSSLQKITCFFTLLAATSVASAAQPVPVIDIHKINSRELVTGPYSYFVQPYNFYYFQHTDKLDFKFDWIKRSGPVYPLQEAKQALATTYTFKNHQYTLEDYFKRSSVLGFLVLKDNKVIYERYFHDANSESRFLSNSVGKSFTSVLVGVALDEGKITSIDDPVIKYLPWLDKSGFNRVTVKQALAMATGVDLSYNADDPHASIHQFNAANVTGSPSLVNLLKSVKAKPSVTPGTVFDYENENPVALGFILEKVTGMSYSAYLQEKIWSKIGAQSDAFLYRAKSQPDQCAYGCLNATLRDYARFGLMMMNGGMLDKTRVVSASWVTASTTPVKYTASVSDPGYGYLWWVPPHGQDHDFEGLGIFGQILYVNPEKHIVIVQASAWPKSEDNAKWEESDTLIKAIVADISR